MAPFLRPQPQRCGGGRLGPLAPAAHAAGRLATVAPAAPPPSAGPGDPAGRGPTGHAAPPGALAPGGEQSRPTGPAHAVVAARCAPQAAAVECPSRRCLGPVTAGTARCGPVCRVVWELRLASTECPVV